MFCSFFLPVSSPWQFYKYFCWASSHWDDLSSGVWYCCRECCVSDLCNLKLVVYNVIFCNFLVWRLYRISCIEFRTVEGKNALLLSFLRGEKEKLTIINNKVGWSILMMLFLYDFSFLYDFPSVMPTWESQKYAMWRYL